MTIMPRGADQRLDRLVRHRDAEVLGRLAGRFLDVHPRLARLLRVAVGRVRMSVSGVLRADVHVETAVATVAVRHLGVERGALTSHSGRRDVTRGMRAKLYSGGGDGIDHSSVPRAPRIVAGDLAALAAR